MPSTTISHQHQFVVGMVAGIVSATSYTLANICLRYVATDTDPTYVSFVKVIPLVLLTGALAGRDAFKGPPSPLSRGDIVLLVGTSAVMQFGGNVAFQWALGIIGLVLTVPLCMGLLLIASSLLARMWLREPISLRSIAAIGLLIVSMSMLVPGADASAASIRESVPFGMIVAGVGAACLSGGSYAWGNVVIRHTVTRGIALPIIMFLISVTGLIVLTIPVTVRYGLHLPWYEPRTMTALIFAGLFNAVAFYALGITLQHISIVQANLLNASQVALCAMCGILLYAEPAGALQLGGILVTMLGLLLMERNKLSGS